MSPIRMSKIESAMRTALAFHAAFNQHDTAAIMKLMSDDCVIEHSHPAPDGAVYTGQEAIAQFWQAFFQASPQAHLEIEEVFGLGERCIMRWQYRWVDANGQPQQVRGVDIFQVHDGLICQKLTYVKGR